MRSILRDYQVDLIAALRETIAQGIKRIVVQSPTGSGKTACSAAIIEGALSKGNKVAFVIPYISLVDQALNMFWAEGITDVGVIQSNHAMTDWSKPLQICSIQTLKNRDRFPEAKLVIIDEVHLLHAHHKTWMAHPDWQDKIFIGLSATPFTKGLGKYFQTLIIGSTTKELIAKGYLSPFRVFASGHPDLSKVKIVAGEYKEDQLSEAMQQGSLTADIVDTWKKKWGKDKTLCFAVDCAHAKNIQERFEKAGITCAYQDAHTPITERADIKRKFHSGEYRVITNVDTLSVGADYDVRCLILARPTRSEMKYCLDSETDILTSHGWKGIGEVKIGDCAATLIDEKTGRGSWSSVSAVIERNMEEKELWVEYKAPRANFRVTDKHGMIAARAFDETREFKRMTALEMATVRGGVYMPTAVKMDQVGVPLTDDELYFIGMMMADGTWTPTIGSITQSERHPEIVARIEACLRSIGIGYARRMIASPIDGMKEKYRRWKFDFSSGNPRAHSRIGNGPLPTKRFSEHIDGHTGFRYLVPYMNKDMAPALMAMSRSQLDKFLQGLWDGDGSKKKGVDYQPRSMEICSARPIMIDRLQALCAINGYTGHVRKEHGPSRKNPIWLITVTPKDWRHIGGYASHNRNQRPQIEIKTATDEKVWCVETETGTIITRRHGKVTVMGNCQIVGRGLRTAKDKDQLMVLDHSDTTQRLGFVDDIHHDSLDDGKEKPKADPRPALPKECKACSFLKPPRTPVCPNCGFKAEVTNGHFERDGELVEITAGAKALKRKKSSDWSMGEKAQFFAELKAYGSDKGYSSGWASHKFKTRFGVWPDHSIKNIAPALSFSTMTTSWIRSQQIAWAKSKRDREPHAAPGALTAREQSISDNVGKKYASGTLATEDDLLKFGR